ncbi:DUF397 domain-containing protein [Streptomyces lunaelactis]|nr:DUF397 domain-containing protein [Streptomyces lunaelactis]NUK40421.1 DUF397 domain-containing protein [Streptomyces lunaelactis]NUK93493.1 DUF397 domain-containing protein [Streptomyces lunaelactis]NUL29177.1 DUF397 domain-containing protein [Streptomyces lunaelactis]
MPDLLAQDELRWRRSSRSVGMNNCVEAARLPDATLSVRDSKNIARQALRFSPTAGRGSSPRSTTAPWTDRTPNRTVRTFNRPYGPSTSRTDPQPTGAASMIVAIAVSIC